ncbi:MAG: hypothetical protein NT133_20090 [Alphaproteobacteria bacterium]|nr:hypothetical protein [Alphaproteobacteria bacterium]
MKSVTLPAGLEALAPRAVREALRMLAWLFGLLAARAAGDTAWPPFPFAAPAPAQARRGAPAVAGAVSDDEDPECVYVMVPAPWSLRFTRFRRAVARPVYGLARWLWRCSRPPDALDWGGSMVA